MILHSEAVVALWSDSWKLQRSLRPAIWLSLPDQATSSLRDVNGIVL